MKRRRLTVRLSPAGNREALEGAVETAVRLAIRRTWKLRGDRGPDDGTIEIIARYACSALWEVLEGRGVEVV